MAYLENCLPIQKYVSEEAVGDGFLGLTSGSMEIQNIPSDIQSEIQGDLIYFFNPISTNYGSYLLVIEAMPGFNIQGSMINIGGVYGGVSASGNFSDIPVWEWSSITTPPTDSVLPTILQGGVWGIKIINSNTNNPESCDNKVYVRVQLPFSFQMPAYDVTVNIDFGGTAVECGANNTTSTQTLVSVQDYSLIIGNGTQANPNSSNIFVARYFESEAYASSIHDARNQQVFQNGNTTFPPTYDPNNSWQGGQYYTDGSIQSFQPTYYGRYKNFIAAFWDSSSTNNITTECGQLIIGTAAQVATTSTSNPFDHPNESPANLIKNQSYFYIFKTANLSTSDYPYLTPGDGILPSSLVWYITVGNNSYYELLPENVDVYKIITTLGYMGGSNNPQAYCPTAGINYNQLLISEMQNGSEVQNNSHLDINNIQCVSVDGSDNKTVKLTMNFQANHQLDIWDFENNPNQSTNIYAQYDVLNGTKIFLNVYPNYIGQ
tara:strand:- start:1210 stop:2679 length:1470 start_codon:yes stop_codon:yes gene_type:complete